MEDLLIEYTMKAIESIYNQVVSKSTIAIQKTKKEFEGDFTLVVFPFTKISRKSPEQTAEDIGNYLKNNINQICSFNIIKGFLNIRCKDSYWVEFLKNISTKEDYGYGKSDSASPVVIEYSSPNTNKPLHLGHIRNNLLGWSLAEILKANGKKVVKVNLVNDRGIHICKSMLAWQLLGNNQDPPFNTKGDKFVGDFYIKFNNKYKDEEKVLKEEASELLKLIRNYNEDEITIYYNVFIYTVYSRNKKYQEDPKKYIEDIIPIKQYYDIFIKFCLERTPSEQLEFDKYYNFISAKLIENKVNVNLINDELFTKIYEILKPMFPIMNAAQEMLKKWESGDPETIALWRKMNKWVYAGFEVTYNTLGIDFDKTYYESETYLLGKKIVEEGVGKVFNKEKDNSIWVDLTDEGLDKKLLLRSDGTSVYMTQDIGTAQLRHDDYQAEKLIYVVGNEQNYHFNVLKLVLNKLGRAWANNIFHLSYGMVELPEGKMKSREGTVVDADDLIKEMIDEASKMGKELGKAEGLTTEESEVLFKKIGLAALKYFILKVDPKKNMMFNPAESIDFNGNTGPFIQYTYARIQSVFRKAKENKIDICEFPAETVINSKEKELLLLLYEYPKVIKEAGDTLSPALIANYVYDLAKEYNQFYHDFFILKEEHKDIRSFRLVLSDKTGKVIKSAMHLLGIDVPNQM